MRLFLGLGKGKARFLVAGVMLSGVIRFAVIHSQGYVPPFVDTPDTASWQERFSVLYDNLYTRFGGLLIGVIGAYLVSFHKEAVITSYSIHYTKLYDQSMPGLS